MDEKCKETVMDDTSHASCHNPTIGICHLNDDCLLHIFEVKSLTLMDLCHLAETCKRFQQLTQRIIPNEIKINADRRHFYYAVQPFDSTSYTKYKTYKLIDIERILKNFGSACTALEISQEDDSDFLLNLIVEHCRSAFKRLKIKGIWFCPILLTAKFKRTFKQLQLLDIEGVTIEDETVFADLNSMVDLRLSGVNNVKAIFQNVFPNLKRFAYDLNHKDRTIHPHIYSTFIARHRGLEEIQLEIYNISNRGSKLILRAIAENCTELEILRINLGEVTVADLQPLDSLKSLRILELL